MPLHQTRSSLNEISTPNPPNLLTLPQEIRDKILDELLISKYWSNPYRPSPQKFDLSIPRVSKALYEQAMETLYEKNCWVVVTVDIDLCSEILTRISGQQGSGVGHIILRNGGIRLRGKVALSVDLRQGRYSQTRTTFVVNGYSMSCVFRAFTTCALDAPLTRIDLRFWENSAARRHQTSILVCLHDWL